MLVIHRQLASSAPGVPLPSRLREWAAATLEQAEAAPGELTVRVVDEAESAALNEAWRGVPGPTNVLSFAADFPPETGVRHLGDLVVCAPVVAREAAAQGKTREAHWAHMIVHGLLHLLGHDHQEERGALAMEGLEREILARLGYPDPYH